MRSQPSANLLPRDISGISDGAFDPHSLLRILRRLSIGSGLVDILGRLLQDDHWLQAVSQHSYHHGNNFDKFVIDSASEFGLKLRLHLWRTEDGSTESDIHDHPWNFASLVLHGSFMMNTYVEAVEVENQHAMMFLPTLMSEPCAMPEAGRLGLQMCGNQHLIAGDSYCLNFDVLHLISPTSFPVITLVLQGAHVSPWTRVISAKKVGERAREDISYFSPEEAAMKLRDVVHILQDKDRTARSNLPM